MDAYQSGVDGQLFVWIDQQKYMPDVSLQKREKKSNNARMIFYSVTWLSTRTETNNIKHLSFGLEVAQLCFNLHTNGLNPGYNYSQTA